MFYICFWHRKEKKKKSPKIQSCSMCCELSLMTLFLSPPAPLSSTTWLRGVWLCCCASREWPCSTTHPSLSETLCSSLLHHQAPFSICWSCHEINKEDKPLCLPEDHMAAIFPLKSCSEWEAQMMWWLRIERIPSSFHHFGLDTLAHISMWNTHMTAH